MFGKDIYWYGVQAISLLETGKLHSPDHSPVFHIAALFLKIFGIQDQSLFLFQILTSVWLLISVILARWILSHREFKFAFVFPSFVILLLGFLYPKQSWALGFLVLSIAFYFSSSLSSSAAPSSSFWMHRIRWGAAGLLFLLALWFHPMVGVFGIGLWVLYQIPTKFYPVIFLLSLLFPFFLPQDPNGRFYSDTEIFPLTAAYGIAGFGILWDWGYLVFGKSEERFLKIRKAIAFFGFLLLLPIFHFADIQYRILLSLIFVIPVFVTWNRVQILIGTVSISLWVFTVYTSPHLFRYPYDLMWIPGESMASVPNNGLLVAHHGFCEYYHFQFRKDCLSFEPDAKAISELPKGTEIYRAVYGIRYENLLASKDEKNRPIFSFVQPLGEYQLVLEEDWKRYRFWLEKRNSKLLSVAKSWKNPYRERPQFMKRKQNYGI
ncbi:hypothetical protein JWG41_19290 [Leptospira sp. 201903075]|uniref:hypothetical protein n=1 Tax=Leptospira chreensis TaxID=2810035 RepID=UPI0019644990|nr:hypothetical protein [Leptospira chreensis]MBM9592575.1 hypothetical protein [Leptospira chreensis]MBM9592592.1 hypothetical protein [Leptospira chreensis]